MIDITKDQATHRWDDLPLTLREALCSDINSDFLWKTCQTEFVPEEKIYSIARIFGYVLMGFLHPEDMAVEIRDSIGIDIRVATSIANALNQRIIAPLRQEIDKAYNPSTPAVTPKSLEEIRPPMAEMMPAPVAASRPSVLPTASPLAPKQEPVKSAPTEKLVPLDEFAQLKAKSVAVPSAAPAPKPVFLQTESIPKPILNAPNFRVPTIAENIMGGDRSSGPIQTKAAVVEIGGMPIPKASAPQAPTTPKVTIVHYGNEKSVPTITPPKQEPTRTITEVTPETLKTVVPISKTPTPSFTPITQIPIPSPAAPKPPVPTAPTAVNIPVSLKPPIPSPAPMPRPTNQPEKVIQKDFMEGGK